jgi:uncharacterized protein YndB with AHSA1/START domain
MPALHFTAHINGSRETVFALIADLAHYDLWLPNSRAFGAVTQVSPAPTGVGTTYVDGTMRGSITEYNPPERITFQQSMPVKVLLLTGKLDVCVCYKLEAAETATRVKRDVTFALHGILKAAQPLVAGTIRRESGRLLEVMKRYMESGDATSV